MKFEKLLWKTYKIWQLLNKNTKIKNEIPFSKQDMDSDTHPKPTVCDLFVTFVCTFK
jgi:hypothetical protein